MRTSYFASGFLLIAFIVTIQGLGNPVRPTRSAASAANEEVQVARDAPRWHPSGYWEMPNGFRFGGRKDLSIDEVNRLAASLASPDGASESELPTKSPPFVPLSQAATERALAASIFGLIVAAVALAILFPAIRGQVPAPRPRKYAAAASVFSAPMWMFTGNAIFLGRFGDAEIGRIVGLAALSVILGVTAYGVGWSQEKIAKIL